MKSITFRIELLENITDTYTHEFKNPRIISACIYLLCLKHIDDFQRYIQTLVSNKELYPSFMEFYNSNLQGAKFSVDLKEKHFEICYFDILSLRKWYSLQCRGYFSKSELSYAESLLKEYFTGFRSFHDTSDKVSIGGVEYSMHFHPYSTWYHMSCPSFIIEPSDENGELEDDVGYQYSSIFWDMWYAIESLSLCMIDLVSHQGDSVSFDNDDEYILTNRPRNSYDPAWIEIIQADRMISSFIETKNKKKRDLCQWRYSKRIHSGYNGM